MPFLASASNHSLPLLRRAIDNLRVDARLDGFEHVAAGQIDRGRLLEGQVELSLMCRDQCLDHQRNLAAGEVMGFQAAGGHPLGLPQTCLYGHHFAANDHAGIDLAKSHPQQVENADPGASKHRLQPESKIPGHHHQGNQHENQDGNRGNNENERANRLQLLGPRLRVLGEEDHRAPSLSVKVDCRSKMRKIVTYAILRNVAKRVRHVVGVVSV